VSVALDFVGAVYHNAHPGSKHSWRKLNASLREALTLAIKSEMLFVPAEIAWIHRNYQGGFWFGSGEWILRAACLAGNSSAASSFNHWKKRKRFPWKGRITLYGYPGCPKLKYLFEWARFWWNDELVEVTSFNDDEGYLIACSYHRSSKPGGRKKVKHRYTITPADLELEKAGSLIAAEIDRIRAMTTEQRSSLRTEHHVQHVFHIYDGETQLGTITSWDKGDKWRWRIEDPFWIALGTTEPANGCAETLRLAKDELREAARKAGWKG